jgi:adenylate cyclase
MSDIFISYARSTEQMAQQIVDALRAQGFSVWWDDQLPVHRVYGEVIEERLGAARAALVIWSAEAARSEWVRSEANRAREHYKLVQVSMDGAPLPMPFDQIQCADLTGWAGDLEAPAWRKVVESLTAVMSGAAPEPAPVVRYAPPAMLALPDKPSIAVLPLVNLTPGQDDAYFADGMAEEITTALARFPSLFVIDSRSGLTYREAGKAPKAIAQELGVRYLLEGSVRRSGERVRVTVNLVDALEGAQIWADRFDGLMSDVFALQEAAANAVACRIEPTIEAAEARRAQARPTKDLGAYELFLRALHLQRKWDAGSFMEALVLLDQAMERDPNFATAFAMASYCYALVAIGGFDPEAMGQKSVDLARKAVRAGADDPRALAWACTAFTFFARDWATATDLAERAVALSPGAALGRHIRGWANMFAGKLEEATSDFDTALRLDPRSPDRPISDLGLGWTLFFQRRLEDSIAVFNQAWQLRPDNLGTLMMLAAAEAHLGRGDDARERLKGLPPNWPYQTWLLAVRDDGHRAFLRAGLAAAGATV